MTLKIKIQIIKDNEVKSEWEIEVPQGRDRFSLGSKIIKKLWEEIKKVETSF